MTPSGGRRFDVIVIGAGILGTTAGYMIARSGQRVAVLDAASAGSATADASGWSVIRQTKSDGDMLDLTERSMEHWRALAQETGAPYEERGSYLLHRAGTEEELVTERVAWLRDRGVTVDRLDVKELEARQPTIHPEVTGASYVDNDGEVDPVAACRRVVTAIREVGGEVMESCAVQRLIPGGSAGVEVRTRDERLTATNVVVAAGTGTPELLEQAGVRLPLRVQKGEQVVTEPTPLRVAGRIVSARYLMSKHGQQGGRPGMNAGLAVGQGPDGRVRIGSTRSLDDTDPSPTEAGRAALLDELRPYLPAVADVPLERQTVGFRMVSPTGRPLVGGVPGADGLLVATGHGGDGIALAALSAAVIRDHVCGEAPETTSFDIPADLVEATAGTASD